MNLTKKFFGWTNLKWLIKEFVSMYSARPSFFSKKRIESGIGFIIAEWGMIYWLLKKHDVMDTMDFSMWASIQFFIAGYIINQIQKKKCTPAVTPAQPENQEKAPEEINTDNPEI